jgi:hypothetical protein
VRAQRAGRFVRSASAASWLVVQLSARAASRCGWSGQRGQRAGGLSGERSEQVGSLGQRAQRAGWWFSRVRGQRAEVWVVRPARAASWWVEWGAQRGGRFVRSASAASWLVVPLSGSAASRWVSASAASRRFVRSASAASWLVGQLSARAASRCVGGQASERTSW